MRELYLLTGCRMKWISVFCLIIGLIAFAGMGNAQSTAAISGTVKDPSGALLAGARITVHSVATGSGRVVISDGIGNYVVPSLQPGEYTVEAKAPGFGLFTVKSLVLQVDQIVALNMSLTLESIGETVEVSKGSLVIDAASITVGQVIGKQTVQEIPLNGRHFMDLSVLAAGGVTAPVTDSITAPSRGVGAYSFLTAGNRGDTINFQINGINLNDSNTAQLVFQPSINTTSEVKVNNSNNSADYGKSSGPLVNVSTRSGTSTFHGEVLDYNRNNSFDARNWFNSIGTPQNAFKRNNFRVAIGGPLLRGKTFFFASYEALRQHQALQLTATVPSATDRAGVPGTVTKALINTIPTATSGANTFSGTANGPVNIDQGTMDILHLLNSKDTVHGFYAYQLDIRTEPVNGGNTVPGFGDTRPGYRQIATINETHVFSSRLVSIFVFSSAWMYSAFSIIRGSVIPERARYQTRLRSESLPQRALQSATLVPHCSSSWPESSYSKHLT
jgi:Carboxypeptidase regulatory-like domain